MLMQRGFSGCAVGCGAGGLALLGLKSATPIQLTTLTRIAAQNAGQKPAIEKSRQESGDEPEHRGIHDEQEEAERQQRRRQRQQNDDRASRSR